MNHHRAVFCDIVNFIERQVKIVSDPVSGNIQVTSKLMQKRDNSQRRIQKSRGGWLSRAAMPEESKHPVTLAKDLHISDLILRQIHKDVGHMPT